MRMACSVDRVEKRKEVTMMEEMKFVKVIQ
jgi:hypothetical protein